MIVPPTGGGLHSEMQMFQVPIVTQDYPTPCRRVEFIDGNPDLHNVYGLEHGENEYCSKTIVTKAALLSIS